ncbi:hypothetical protein Tco_0674072 [Tanacetum coccineum]
MYYPRFIKVIIHHFISKDKSISMRNKIFMHTVRDDSVLGTLRFVSKSNEYQLYGALLTKGISNQQMRDSPTYKTYLAFATGAATPKKARKFKKLVSLSKKKTLIVVEEPAEKPTKKPATRRQSLKKAIKRRKWETNIHQAGGSSEGAHFESEVPDEPKDKSINTSEGTSLKLWVPDQSKDERIESDDDDKDADINKADDEEEDEFIHTLDDHMKDTELEGEGKDDADMTDVRFVDVERENVTTTSTTADPDSETLSTIHQRLFDVENEVKTLRNVDHNSTIRAVVKSEFQIVVKDYLGTSLDDALHKALQRHTEELIKEHSVPEDVTDVLQQQPKP